MTTNMWKNEVNEWWKEKNKKQHEIYKKVNLCGLRNKNIGSIEKKEIGNPVILKLIDFSAGLIFYLLLT